MQGKKILVLGAAMAGGLGLSLLSGCEHHDAAPPAASGAIPVAVVTVQASDVPIRQAWVGTLDGFVNAQIQPQVTGYLIRQDYREGSQVAKGQVLFEIDPRPLQAALQQAQGQLGQAQGQLAQAQAQLELAQINVKRDTPLAEQRAIAQSTLDNDRQTFAQRQAEVQSAQAQIVTSQAAVSTAQLNLGFTRVRSLISGIAGQATTQVGNLVSTQSVLTSVSQLDPIKVYFSMSDSEYLALSRRSMQGKADLLQSTQNIPLRLTLADGTTFPHPGHIAFVDRGVNQQTGSIRIAAVFTNPGNVLRPGQFGRVSADTQVLRDALAVPQYAVQDLQGIKQLYTVGADNKVHVINVLLGPQAGANWVINSGVTAGTRVITDQIQKLKEGMPVAPHPAGPAAPTSQVSESVGK